MCTAFRTIAWAVSIFTLANAWWPSSSGTARAQDESRLAKSARGGALTKVGRNQFEVFFYTTGLRVFPQDVAGVPLDVSRLIGTATFYHPNSPEPWFARPLHPAAAGPGRAPESLDLALDLSRVPPKGARVEFEIVGLSKPGESPSRFAVPFEFLEAPAESRAGRPARADVHGYAPIASTAYYFPLTGYYSTPTGVVWVPAPGYYHVGAPTQYFRPGAYRPPDSWERAHPAPSPTPTVAQSVPPDLSGIHTEYYWHPRPMGEPAAHEAWIRGQLREKYGPGTGP